MAFGLGHYSPVVLSQSKVNFEALISRHGQYLRWRVAKKCPCITQKNRPNIHCLVCGGSGDSYDYQREYEDIFRIMVRENIITIPKKYAGGHIIEVYNSHGKRFEYVRYDDYLQILGEAIPNNTYVDVRVRIPIVKNLEFAKLEKIGAGYYRVPGIYTEPSDIDKVYYRAAGDVISVDELKDENGEQVKALGFRRDMILIDSASETITAKEIEYVMPFKFIVLSQNLTKEDEELINTHKGDAVCTFPYMFNLSENDVLTVLSGDMTHKVVLEKRGKEIDDTINSFFVSSVDNIETMTQAYKEGEDFVLIGTNNIHWIGKQPEDNEKMSITYRYFPTYRVAKEVPMLRTSENQRIPRKVMLKLYGAYGEAKRVNVND
jgi:hypothetical protein